MEDYKLNGKDTIVDYDVIETKSVNIGREVFTDLGDGKFDQRDEPAFVSQIVDIKIHSWVDMEENPLEWTESDKQELIAFLNENG